MSRCKLFGFILVLVATITTTCAAQNTVDLAGAWRFQRDGHSYERRSGGKI